MKDFTDKYNTEFQLESLISWLNFVKCPYCRKYLTLSHIIHEPVWKIIKVIAKCEKCKLETISIIDPLGRIVYFGKIWD